MEYNDIVFKIENVINKINERILLIENKKATYSKNIHLEYDDPIKKRYEIEKNTYYINKYDDDIKRCELFKERCKYYSEYLFYLQKKDIIEIKKNEYNFVRTLQEELVFYYDSKIRQVKQKNYINKLCGQDDGEEEIKTLQQERDKKYNRLTKDFKINNNKIYTLDYLNFDIEKMIDLVFKKK